MVLLCSHVVFGQSVLLQEEFSLTAGTDLDGQNSWTLGSTSTNNIVISNTSLNYSGYPNSGTGNAASCIPPTDRLQRPFTGPLSGTYYYSFLVNVSAAGSGDYFIGYFYNNAFRGRVYIKSDAGGFQFGLVKTSSGTVTYTLAAPYSFNTTYLVVVKYEFLTSTTADDIVSLFVNPSMSGDEPAAPTIGPLTDTGTDVASNVIALQGRTNSGTMVVDGIRIATDWDSLFSVSAPLRSATVVIQPSNTGCTVSDRFVGFSFNPAYSSQYFGTNYNGNNSRSVSVKLMNNLFPYQNPGIRIIGANNSYWQRSGSLYSGAPAAWNNSGVSFPYIPATVPAFTTTIDQTDLNDLEGLLDGLSYTPSVLFGVNLAVIDDGRSADFAAYVKSTLKNSQRPALDLQFEIGNEPDAYVTNARRLSGYGYSDFQQEFNLIANAVKTFGSIAGPALAKSSYTQEFAANVQNFISSTNTNVGNGTLSTVTYHDYPLGCASDGFAASFLEKFYAPDPNSSKYAEKYTRLEVTQDLAPSITAANLNGVLFRMAETNSICAGGKDSASNSFGAALWAMDYMFELAKAGGAGINFSIEGSSTASYSPWTFNASHVGTGIVAVRPIYYGVLFFSRAVQNHAQFVANSWTASGGPHLKIWSVQDAAGIVRVMVINKGTSLNDDTSCTVTVRIPTSITGATLYDLKPASGGIAAISGTSISGQSVSLSGGTAGELTGTLSSVSASRTFGNDTTSFTFSVPAASAVILETNSAVLPVELTSFSAFAAAGSVHLQWSTATEVNNYGFNIERSEVRPQQSASNIRLQDTEHTRWTVIGFVEGSGTSNSPKEYSFIDHGTAPGKYIYRLKQTDRDGRFEYSGTVEVTIRHSVPRVLSLSACYPNPFNPSTMLEFTVPQTGAVVLQVYSMLGSRVAVLFDGNAVPGQVYRVGFNGSAFSTGQYFAVLRSNGRSLVQRMLLLK